MTPALHNPKEQRLIYSGINWEQFKSIQSGFAGSGGIGLSYYQETLELVTTNPEREIFKSIIGYLVETFFLEQGIRIIPTGAMAQERARIASVQADKSYCLGEFKPISDLSIEIEFSRGSDRKLERYRVLGVPEIWFWEDGRFILYHLRTSGYQPIPKSELAPTLDFELLTRCVSMADLTDAVTEFKRGDNPSQEVNAMLSYLQLDDLLDKIDEPYQTYCRKIASDNQLLFEQGRGSSKNHQAWPGGYIDHLHEVMNLAAMLYPEMNRHRPLPFSLSEALLVLFIHDLEKPWTYEQINGNWQRKKEFRAKDEAHRFRLRKLAEYGLQLPPELNRAIFFVEGEVDEYSNQQRAMSPLAAFCHMCDVASARLWYDYPQDNDDPWPGAKRFRTSV